MTPSIEEQHLSRSHGDTEKGFCFETPVSPWLRERIAFLLYTLGPPSGAQCHRAGRARHQPKVRRSAGGPYALFILAPDDGPAGT